MSVESPVHHRRTANPWPVDSSLLAIGKAGVDFQTDGPNDEIAHRYPKGYKGSVGSTADVLVSIRPVTIKAVAAGGNVFNFGVASSEPSLSLPPVNVHVEAHVGRDKAAELYRDALSRTRVTPRLVEYTGDTAHSYVFPTKDNRVILSQSLAHQELPLFKEPNTPPGYIYLTSIAGNNWHENYDLIRKYATRENVFLAVSAGTPQFDSLTDASELGALQRESLYKAIAAAGIVFGNKEEITKLVNGTGVDAQKDASQLLFQAKEVLGCETISMTDGENGSMYIDYDDTILQMPIFERTNPAAPPPQEDKLDFTGAGDTYAAGFMRGFMAGETIENCMRRGAASAAAVIHETGVPVGFAQRNYVERNLVETAGDKKFEPEVVYMSQRRKQHPLDGLAKAS